MQCPEDCFKLPSEEETERERIYFREFLRRFLFQDSPGGVPSLDECTVRSASMGNQRELAEQILLLFRWFAFLGQYGAVFKRCMAAVLREPLMEDLMSVSSPPLPHVDHVSHGRKNTHTRTLTCMKHETRTHT